MILLVVSALLAFGLNFLLELSGVAVRTVHGHAAQATLRGDQVGLRDHRRSRRPAVPAGTSIQRIRDARTGEDLTSMSYGKDWRREEVRGALIGAFAKCWQLPFCREGIRVKCPIYHARTKCWKQRVGCMCEENVLRLPMGGDENKPIDMTRQRRFRSYRRPDYQKREGARVPISQRKPDRAASAFRPTRT